MIYRTNVANVPYHARFFYQNELFLSDGIRFENNRGRCYAVSIKTGIKREFLCDEIVDYLVPGDIVISTYTYTEILKG